MWGVSYWVFPVISAFVWCGMLISMLVYWCAIGKPHYASMDPGQNIAYISDVGAQKLKPLFIAGACVTTVFLDLAFLSERWLRHNGRLARNTSMVEKVLSGLSICFAIIGTAGLILLSIFDTLRHPRLHDIFLLLFIGGYIISAIFICAEYQRLGIHFREHRYLRHSFWIKLAFIIIELILAIAFGCTTYKGSPNVAAVLEWAVAFIFTFYVLSFIMDLAPAVRTKGHTSKTTEMQLEQNDVDSDQHRNDYYGDGMNNGVSNGHGGTSGHAGNGGYSQTHGPNHGPGKTVNGVFYPNGALQPKPNVANNY